MRVQVVLGVTLLSVTAGNEARYQLASDAKSCTGKYDIVFVDLAKIVRILAFVYKHEF